VILNWQNNGSYEEAVIGSPDAGDGVTFTLQHQPTCYRRGPYKLLVEVASGPGHTKWGCFDDQDQPERWFHKLENAKDEADSLARVLLQDRAART
jgi:hypothetical protein